MSLTCEHAKDRLLDLAEGASPDVEVRAHLDGCASCTAVLAALVEVDAGLLALPPIDAPKELLAVALDRVERQAREEHGGGAQAGPTSLARGVLRFVLGGLGSLLAALVWPLRAFRRHPIWATGLTAASAATAGVLVMTMGADQADEGMVLSVSEVEQSQRFVSYMHEVPEESPPSPPADPASTEGLLAALGWGDGWGDDEGGYRDSGRGEVERGSYMFRQRPENGRWDLPDDGEQRRASEEIIDVPAQRHWESTGAVASADAPEEDAPSGASGLPRGGRLNNGLADRTVSLEASLREGRRGGQNEVDDRAGQPSPERDEGLRVETTTQARLDGLDDESGQQAAYGNREAAVGDARLRSLEDQVTEPEIADVSELDEVDLLVPAAEPPALAEAFLAERSRVEGLTFEPSHGLWSSSYVPGDPRARAIAARLSVAGAPALAALAERAHQRRPPVDAPRQGALAVDVRADRRGAQGEVRALLSVTLAAAERRSRARPPMRVGVVLDLSRAPSAQDEACVRATLGALARLTDPADRVSLTVAGRPGATLVPSGPMRHGRVAVALRRLFAEPSAGERAEVEPPAPTLALSDAITRAVTDVGAGGGVDAPLGSGLVLVLTPGLAEGDPAAQRAAHLGAIAGVPTSVVGLGGAPVAPVEQLALAGQGRRLVLTDPERAEALVGRELSAASRVVARAVRLEIALAPGVRLVEVVGAERLDATRAARARRAEAAIDRRLARELGIGADRDGQDRAVTLLIPAFEAGDRHEVLLDVVAAGPGPVAEVSARYKDLVRLGNGEARAALSLSSGAASPGPRELSVTSSLLAHELSWALEDAADALALGDAAGAREALAEHAALLRQLRAHAPQLATDRALAADLALTTDYLRALAQSPPSRLATLTDSLRLASRRTLTASLAVR